MLILRLTKRAGEGIMKADHSNAERLDDDEPKGANMKLKTWLCLLLAFLMVASLVACKQPVEETPGNTPETPEDKPGEGGDEKPEDKPKDPTQLYVIEDGKTNYKLIRGDSAKAEVKTAFTTLQAALKEKTGVSIPMDTDWAEKGETEILVGKTNRPESQEALQELEDLQIIGELEGHGFLIRVQKKTIIIIGTTDECTSMGVDYFISHFLKDTEGEFFLPKSTLVYISRTNILLGKDTEGSKYKKHYSDYVKDFTEEQLISFDDLDIPDMQLFESYSIDKDYQREGYGALRFVTTTGERKLTQLMWGKGIAFDASVEDTKKSTLKLWVYVDNDDMIACDHDAVYGEVQKDQATFFFRLMDNKGRIHSWNHTLTGDGWHEIELSFNIHNSVDAAFDYGHIANFGIMVGADEGTIIEFDDLRLVKYESDYVPEELPDGDRLITDGEYNAFDGAMIQEWYGCSYDLENKKFGNSSLRNQGDSSVNDFRTIVSDLNIPVDYDNDTLVFWLKVEKLSVIRSFFIELNQIQDNHEYEKSFTVADLQQYGLTKTDNEWCEIRIPVSVFEQNLLEGYDENLTLYAFRFVTYSVGEKEYVINLDHVYLTAND